MSVVIIKPHRHAQLYARRVVRDVAWSVCLSVCLSVCVSVCWTRTIEVPLGLLRLSTRGRQGTIYSVEPGYPNGRLARDRSIYSTLGGRSA